MATEDEKRRHLGTLATLDIPLEDLTKAVQLAYRSNFEKFEKLTVEEKKTFLIELQVKAAAAEVKNKDLEAAKTKEEEERIEAKFAKGGIREVVDLSLDSSLMVKSFGALRLLYHLQTRTDAQEIAWKILWSVVALEIVIFFLIILKRLCPVGVTRKAKFTKYMNLAIILIGTVCIISELALFVVN